MVTTTFCTSGAVLVKIGIEADSISGAVLLGTDDSAIDSWIIQAEGTINTMSRYNFLTGYSGYTDGIKQILEGVASDLAAINGIIFDMSVFNSRIEAEDKINVLRDSAMRGLAILRDKKNQKFLQDPTTGSV